MLVATSPARAPPSLAWGEAVREPGAGVHLQQQLGQVHARQPGGDGRLERDQAGGFLQLVQGGQHQVAAVHLHAGVPRQVRSRVPVGGVQPLGQARDLGQRVGGEAQGAADGRPCRLPCRSCQQAEARVGVAEAGGGEQVPAPDAGPHAIQQAQPVAQAVHATIPRLDLTPPPVRHEAERRGRGRAAAVRAPQVAHGVQRALPGRGGAEADGTEQRRQEAQLATLGAQLSEVQVARRPDDGVDLLQRRGERGARHDGEGRLPHGPVLHGVIHQHAAGAAELEGRGVEVADGPQPGALADLGRIGEQGRDHDVEQVEHIVLRARLQRPHEGEQGGGPPLPGQPRHGLRLGDRGEARQRRHPTRRDVRGARQAQGQRPHLVEPGDGTGQLGAAAKVRAIAQAVERAGPSALAGEQQGVKLPALLSGHVAGQGAPEPPRGAGADARDQALKGRCSGQQDLLRHQPGRRAVEQHAGPVGAGPAQGVEPARQAEAHERVGELAVAVALPDLGGVQPAHPAGIVLRQAARVGDAELPRQVGGHPGRHGGGIVEEGAQEADGAELDREAQAHVVPSFRGGQVAVGVVEVEVPGKLVGRRLAGVAAIPPLLLGGQEGDRHVGAASAASGAEQLAGARLRLPLAVHVGVQRADGDAELLGDVGGGVAAFGHHRHGRAQLGAGHQPRPSAGPPARAGRGEAGHRALQNQVALELGQGGEDAEHQPARGDGRVDAAGEHLEADAPLLQAVHQLDDVPERAADPVELPDHEGVALPRHVQGTGEAGAAGDGAGAGVVVDALRRDAGSQQRVAL